VATLADFKALPLLATKPLDLVVVSYESTKNELDPMAKLINPDIKTTYIPDPPPPKR
jgi:hypothetical protein